ncbi:MAG TPA: glycosyltransferase family 4 protein [Oscillospiraceae bacterium]|nr:glycosyltransferase family 4 protein [Oscillospiraceae bacterium]
MNILFLDLFGGYPGDYSANLFSRSEYRELDFGESSDRMKHLSAALEKQGHTVTVLAGLPTLDSDEPDEHKKEGMFLPCEHGEAVWLYVRVRQDQNNSSIPYKALLDYNFLLYEYASDLAKMLKPDAVVSASAYPFDIYPARKIAKKAGAKLIRDLHDLLPDRLLAESGPKPSPAFLTVLRGAVKRSCGQPGLVISSIPSSDEWMEKFAKPQKFLYLSAAASDTRKKCSEFTAGLIERIEACKAEGRFTFLYSGPVTDGRSLRAFLLAAKDAKENPAFFLSGDGSYKIILRRIAKEQNIENFYFLDAVPEADEKALLSAADCVFFGTKKSSLSEYGFSAEPVLSRMLSGRPLVCATGTPNAPVARTNCGILTEPEDAAGIVSAVDKMQSLSAQERNAMGAAGRKYVLERHSYDILAERYASAIENLGNPPPKEEPLPETPGEAPA